MAYAEWSRSGPFFLIRPDGDTLARVLPAEECTPASSPTRFALDKSAAFRPSLWVSLKVPRAKFKGNM